MAKIFRSIHKDACYPKGSVVCIGAFDGVHVGHQALIKHTVARAKQHNLPSIAVSFDPLPKEFFCQHTIPRLSTLRDKLQTLFAHGIDAVLLLRFNQSLANLTAEEFILRILKQRLATRELWTGTDFRFGRGRCGNVDMLSEIGPKQGFHAYTIAPVFVGQQRVSATTIRHMLAHGQLMQVRQFLARPYTISGRVVYGRQLARTLGYPTANISFAYTPALTGVYAVYVRNVQSQPWPAIAHFGGRPTFGQMQTVLEVHLFDFQGDLYHHHLAVEFVAKVRDVCTFANTAALQTQIQRDSAEARALLSASAP